MIFVKNNLLNNNYSLSALNIISHSSPTLIMLIPFHLPTTTFFGKKESTKEVKNPLPPKKDIICKEFIKIHFLKKYTFLI